MLEASAPLVTSRLAMITAASCIASLLSPTSYHSYAVAWQNWFGETELALTPEMKSLNFRAPEHYLLMLLAMFAFFALGRQQAKDPFKVMLLAVSAVIGFAFQQEAWVLAVVSVAIIGDVFFPAEGQPVSQVAQIGIVGGCGRRLDRSRRVDIAHPFQDGGVTRSNCAETSSSRLRFHSAKSPSCPHFQRAVVGRLSDLVSARLSRLRG